MSGAMLLAFGRELPKFGFKPPRVGVERLALGAELLKLGFNLSEPGAAEPKMPPDAEKPSASLIKFAI